MDLTALNAWLAGLGPWGIALGAALTIAAKILRDRMSKQPQPAPAPAPAPAPQPQPAPSDTPLLDALLQVLRLRLTKRVFAAGPGSAPVSADITPEQFSKVVDAARE